MYLQPLIRNEKFEDAGLHPAVMDNIKLAQYEKPTPIQQYAIPAVMNGYDVVAVAQTGKTFSLFWTGL